MVYCQTLVRSSPRRSTPDEPPITQTELHSSQVLSGPTLASVDVPAPIRRSQSCRGSPGFNITKVTLPVKEGVPGGSDGKESACSVGDLSSIPGWGRSPGEGNGYPLQYSCLDNQRDRGAWQAIPTERLTLSYVFYY